MDVGRKILKVVALPSNNYGEKLWIEDSEKAKHRVKEGGKLTLEN